MENLFENYDKYVEFQTARAKRTVYETRKHEGRREWFYGEMIKNKVSGKNVLCLGSRDKSEVEFFKRKGFSYVVGIDLFESNGIIQCDMSKMIHHPVINKKMFDVVVAIDALEHCLDQDGFLENLNVLCNGYFVCYSPLLAVPSQWDCAIFPFAKGVGDDDDFKKKLELYFDEFDVIQATISRNRKKIFFVLKKNKKKIFNKVVPSSLKSFKNHSRVDFLSYLLEEATCAELGVYEGGLSTAILNTLYPKKFYAVDAYWLKFGENFWWDNKSTRGCYEKAKNSIEQADKNHCCEFCVENDVDFLNRFPDHYFDWIYLDTSHLYAETLEELDIICRKVKEEGYMCGHDFVVKPFHIHFEVVRAISKWLHLHPEYELYLLDNYKQWIIRKKS